MVIPTLADATVASTQHASTTAMTAVPQTSSSAPDMWGWASASSSNVRACLFEDSPGCSSTIGSAAAGAVTTTVPFASVPTSSDGVSQMTGVIQTGASAAGPGFGGLLIAVVVWWVVRRRVMGSGV